MRTSDYSQYQTEISVIIPCGPNDKYLQETLECLKNQSQIIAEYICIFSGVSYLKENIKKQYENDARYIFVNVEIQGTSALRNHGLKLANGKYICFIDADDRIKPHCLFELYQHAISNNLDQIVYGYEYLPPQINKKKSPVPHKIINKFHHTQIFKLQFLRPYVWNHLIKKEIIKNNKISFNESLQIGEDQEFIIKCLYYSKRIECISNQYYEYRLHQDSTMSLALNNPTYIFYQHVSLVCSIANFFENDPIIQDKYYLSWVFDTLYWKYINLSDLDKKQNYEKINSYLKKTIGSSQSKKLIGKRRYLYDILINQKDRYEK